MYAWHRASMNAPLSTSLTVVYSHIHVCVLYWCLTIKHIKNTYRYDRRTGSFQATDLGRIASHYYITYTTLAAFSSHLKPTMGDIELLRLFSLADEFK